MLGFGNLFSVGQFGGVNSLYQTPLRPFQYGSGLGDSFVGGGGIPGGIGAGGYYKSASPTAPVAFHDFATTEKDLQYADQFYSFEKKLLQNKATEKSFETEPKIQANSYRNFVWQSS